MENILMKNKIAIFLNSKPELIIEIKQMNHKYV